MRDRSRGRLGPAAAQEVEAPRTLPPPRVCADAAILALLAPTAFGPAPAGAVGGPLRGNATTTVRAVNEGTFVPWPPCPLPAMVRVRFRSRAGQPAWRAPTPRHALTGTERSLLAPVLPPRDGRPSCPDDGTLNGSSAGTSTEERRAVMAGYSLSLARTYLRRIRHRAEGSTELETSTVGRALLGTVVVVMLLANGAVAQSPTPGALPCPSPSGDAPATCMAVGTAHVDVQGTSPLSLDLTVDRDASTVEVPDGALVAVFQDSAGPYLSIAASTSLGPQSQPAVRIAPDAASDYGGSTSDACVVDITSSTAAAVSGTFDCTGLPSNTGPETIDASGAFSIAVPAPVASGSPPTAASPGPASPSPGP